MPGLFGRGRNEIAVWHGRHASAGIGVRLLDSFLLALAVVLIAAAPASAASKAVLGSFGTPNGQDGGQLLFARGVAVNKTTGSVYVAEGNTNHRISQFSETGAFIRTWGYDVIEPGKANDNVTGFEICDVTNGNAATDCKQGAVAGGAAGQISNPLGIAIDQVNGYLYIPSTGNRRVDIFSATGQFVGAFGYDVLPADPNPPGPDFCTTATTCQTGTAGSNAGQFGAINASIPAIDPNVPNKVFIPDPVNLRVNQYSTTINGSGVLTAVSFDKAFGWDVIPVGGSGDTGAGLESCTIASTCKAGVSGNGAGQFVTGGSPSAVAVDTTGAIYVTSGPLTSGTCSAATPCRVQKFASDASSAVDFGPASGLGQLIFTSGAANAVAGINLAIDTSNNHVFVLRKETSTTYRVLEYDSAGTFLDTHPSGSALPAVAATVTTGLAVGTSNRIYVNYGASAVEQSKVFILGPVPPPSVEIFPATDVEDDSAQLNGEVTVPAPGGDGFETKYFFEYSDDGINWDREPLIDASVGSVAGPHDVDVDLAELEANTLYLARLVARTGETVTSEVISFKTDTVPPRIALTFADEVTQTAASLGAHIDPEGLKTTYHFEWATALEWEDDPGEYGHRIPAFERQLGAGNEVVIAQEGIAGLESASTYHFRVVATNAEDTIEGPDQTFETLNSCGLTDGRCFEFVSPADKGPVGAAGDDVALGAELRFQAAPEEPQIAYEMAYGLPGATAGNELLYQAERSTGGWASHQLAPPVLEAPNSENGSESSDTLALSRDLNCGVYSSTQPLTADTPSVALEAGMSNLYRRGSDGTWTIISNLEPSHISLGVAQQEYTLIGMSQDCNRVIFRTGYTYPGLPGVGQQRLYEWNNGVLGSIGTIPGPSGPVIAEVVPGASEISTDSTPGDSNNIDWWNAVSDDASRVYFTAVSQVGGDVGKHAIFLRDGSGVAKDVSQSQTATANNDASLYQTAAANGSRVFFLARYGLAINGSSSGASICEANGGGPLGGAGCDLYRYSVAGETLTDLSPDSDGGGAGVAGVLAASDDGQAVYFAARGQLIPGTGPSESANIARDDYSVYLWKQGTLKYVAQIEHQDLSAALVLESRRFGTWTSRATPDGEHLLFESSASVTDYQGGAREAYLYDAATESVVCVSCRRDGGASLNPPNASILSDLGDVANTITPAQSLTGDGTRVYFISLNRLAFGATAGKKNLYQWENGQISFVAGSPPGSGFDLQFAGASETGDDLYFTTLHQLTWADKDGQLDIYDAKVEGGFPEPSQPPAPCDPLTEGCLGGPATGGGAALPPASVGITGPGNEAPKSNNKKKKKKKNNKKKNNKKKNSNSKQKQRTAKQTGRASK